MLSHAAAASADARQLEEDLVAHLMFEHGVDVSVVPHLAQLTEGTTGLLCLEGIKGDFVLLTWLEPQVARSILAERGVFRQAGGTPSSDRCDSDAATKTAASERIERNIYILQLQPGAPASGYLSEILRLRDAAQLRTFSLDVLGPSRANRPPARSDEPQRPRESPPVPSTGPSAHCDREPLPAVDELDQLLDQLDALDL
ncbi:MAG: hypothetical protein JJ992_06840 [Planctomycetes bacterium]|nr:hypothetical protein [Planctomycetota bacterium]